LAQLSPLVSVVIPVWNREDTIIEAATSVLQQTHREIQLIIVDDGSSDATVDRARSIRDSRVDVVRLGRNLGANAARNRGIAQSKGEYIAFHDSDDIWLPRKLEVQLNCLTDSHATICFCAMTREHSGRRTIVPKRSYGIESGKLELSTEILRGSFIGAVTLLLQRAHLEDESFDEDLGRLQDWDLCIRLAQKSEFYFINEPLVVVQEGNNRITVAAKSYVAAVDQILKKHTELFSKHRDALGIARLNAGLMALQDGEISMAARQFALAVSQSRVRLPSAFATLARRYLEDLRR
jgi:glycosyltransferase involved in cell wall biosynthesis